MEDARCGVAVSGTASFAGFAHVAFSTVWAQLVWTELSVVGEGVWAEPDVPQFGIPEVTFDEFIWHGQASFDFAVAGY